MITRMTRPLPQKSAGSLCGPGMFAVALGPPVIVMTLPGPAGANAVVGEVPEGEVVVEEDTGTATGTSTSLANPRPRVGAGADNRG